MEAKSSDKSSGSKKLSRRDFFARTATVASAAALTSTAASYKRILGANDRIHIGQIGCSDRAALAASVTCLLNHF